MKMKRTVRTQLLLSFLLISIILVGFLSLLTVNLMNNHFAKYVDDKYSDTLTSYQHTVENAYDLNEEEWSEEPVSNIGEQASQNNVLMTVTDKSGELVWSTETHQGSGMGSMMGGGRHHMQQDHCAAAVERIDKNNPDYVETTLPLMVGSQEVGTITFGYYGALKYTASDVQFMSSMKRNLLLIFFLALPLSLLLASVIARLISRPLTTVNTLTKKVAQGDYSQQIELATPITEISELIDSVNELTTRLNSQDRLRKQMSTDIAHEIRTPLTTLQGNIEAMIDGIWEVTPERLQVCQGEIMRLTRLVANIEGISRLEEQQESLTKSQFDLYELSQQISANFRGTFADKGLAFELQGESVQITADQDKLSQVLTNLLSNAMKFTSSGTIDLKISEEGEEVLLAVSDTGIGLTDEEQRYIFDRFYMADEARSRAVGGQGIGLAIVKSIVEAHQGSVTVQSQPGEGTTFFIRLPK